MDRRGHRLRFAAVAVCVVLALTGFSTGRGHGHSSHGHSGGGCSSSGQDHDSSSSSGGTSGSRYRDYDDDDDYTDDTSGGSGSSSSSAALQDATVQLEECATPGRAYATVRVDNPNATDAHFTVTVDFLDAGSDRLEEAHEDVYVAGNGTTTVQVDLSVPGAAAKVDHCNPEPYAPAA